MTASKPPAAGLGHHGASGLPSLDVATYNAELRDSEGFIGDRASNRAFRAILEDVRVKLRLVGDDPLGDTESSEISKKALDKILIEGDPEAAGVVHGAIEGFAAELATVTGRFLRTKDWKGTQRIVVGGGLRASRVGELAIGRASVLVKEAGHAVDLVPIQHHPDEAGIVGTIYLAPTWVFTGFDAVLGVDIGGSNIRAGVVALPGRKSHKRADAEVVETVLWRHRDDKPKRDEAIEKMVSMLMGLVKKADKAGLSLAPFIGVGCPGVIEADGSILKGAQNLPGNWESSRFNLPELLREKIPQISGHPTHVLMHNDAVVQGLSQTPFMADVERWAVLTIGTGLGNACFVNHEVARSPAADAEDENKKLKKNTKKSAESEDEAPESEVESVG